MAKQPFFIIGTKRGGTTLLRLMINNHPNLAVPPESHFITPMLKFMPVDKPLTKEQQQGVRKLILQGGRFNTWQTSIDEIDALFRTLDSGLYLHEILDKVFTLEMEKMNKPRWGDKTPEYLHIIDGLQILFPQAKFIFLVRDGRDVINSLKTKGWEGWSIYQRSKYWADGMRDIRYFMRKYSAQSLLVKYEYLVRQPEIELRKICHFLGEDYHSRMLEYHLNYENNITQVEKENNIHTKLSRLPSMSDIQKWKKTADKRELFLAESVMYRELREMSYLLSEYDAKQPRHRLKGICYRWMSWLNIGLFHFYHRLFRPEWKEAINQTLLGKTMRKLVRSS